MTYTEHKITLDIHKTVSAVSVRVKKGDTGRRLLIHLAEKGFPYHITDDCYAVFTATKPDGKVVFNNCYIEDCMIAYDFTAQTVAVAGLVECEIILYGSDGKQLTSSSFNILVEDTIYDTETEIESTNEYNALADLIGKTQKILHGSAAQAIVQAADGAVISVTDASDQALQGLRIFGKSTQDGTPTPDSPVEIVSAEAPVITVTDGTEVQTLTIPHSLPGISVTSGGNYTDADGQEWICDEVDFTRGVYVQRIAQYQVSSVRETSIKETTNGIKWAYGVEVKDSALHTYMGKAMNYILNNKFPMVEQASEDMESVGTILTAYGHADFLEFRFRLMKSEYADKAAVEAAIIGTVIYYLLAEPIETELTADQIDAYAALHTYKPNTTIYNDAGAYMAAEYVADTKTYVDKKIDSASVNIVKATVE